MDTGGSCSGNNCSTNSQNWSGFPIYYLDVTHLIRPLHWLPVLLLFPEFELTASSTYFNVRN